MSEEGYNGWANYPTWSIHLHLSNDQGSYLYWAEAARQAVRSAKADPDEGNHGADKLARWALADRLRKELTDPGYGWVPSLCTGTESPANLLGWDLLEWAVSVTNWREIASSFMEAAGEDAFPAEYYDPEDEGEDS